MGRPMLIGRKAEAESASKRLLVRNGVEAVVEKPGDKGLIMFDCIVFAVGACASQSP